MAPEVSVKVALSIKKGYDVVASHELVLPADADEQEVADIVAETLKAMRAQVTKFTKVETVTTIS